MKQKLKDFYNYFLKYYTWFISGIVILELIDLAHYLMNYPSDIAFYAGLFIYIFSICVVGYGIYSIINKQLKTKKNEN